jgi:uncharacterized protein involved in cysteine biosynthesis
MEYTMIYMRVMEWLFVVFGLLAIILIGIIVVFLFSELYKDLKEYFNETMDSKR